MSAVPAARYLTDFSIDRGTSGGVLDGAGPDAQAGAQAKLDEAFARGVETGRAAAQAEFEAKFASQQTIFAKRLELERQKWIVGTGGKLATGLAAGIKELEARIAETTARILKPFLEAEVHRQAIAELRSSLDALVATDPEVKLHVEGPADILDILREQLASKHPPAVFETSDDCDVRIVAGQAVLETRLKDWMAKLEEAIR